MLSGVSCQQVDIEGGKGGDASRSSFLPDEIMAVSPKKGIGVDVEVEDMKSMTPDGTKVYWEEGDQIALFPGAENESERYRKAIYTAIIDGGPQPAATFRRNQDIWPYRDGQLYLAAYPASAVDRWGSNTRLTCYATIPTLQTARAGSWDPSAGIIAASSKTPEFKFDHAVSYVRFVVDASTSPFVSARVAYPDLPSVLTGESLHVNVSVANQLTISYSEESISVDDYKASTQVVLNDYSLNSYPSTKAELTSSDGQPLSPGTYYIAVMPRNYANGLSFVFTDANGNVAVKKLDGPVDLSPGDVANVGTVGTLTFKTPIQNHTVWSDAGGADQGVVFWVDEADPTKAKIVSICNHTPSPWATEDAYFGAESTTGYLKNYNTIVGLDDFSVAKFPAVGYCKQLRDATGGKWHLPTVEDMKILYNSYYGRNYISPLRGTYTEKDGSGNITLSVSGHDFRYKHENMSKRDYQTVLSTKKNFDDLLASIGEPSPASLDGVSVTGSSGSYSIDPATLEDPYGRNTAGANNGVAYWLHNETKSSGSTLGHNAFICRIGHFQYGNELKSNTNNKYIRCIREVTLE